MRGSFCLFVAVAVGCAHDDHFAQRAPCHHIPKEHTAERAGIDRCANHLQPSTTEHTVLGYVNCTTFGSDYVGLLKRPGRVFPGLWPRCDESYSDKYATDPPFHVKDIFALQPFRRAVKEAKLERCGHEEPGDHGGH